MRIPIRVFLLSPLLILLPVHCAWSTPAPVARLTYTGQPGPEEDYSITGFPGCVQPRLQVAAFSKASGVQAGEATADEDGAFSLHVKYESGNQGILIKSIDQDLNQSVAVPVRHDYPLLSQWNRPNERGYVNMIPESMDARQHAASFKAWMRDRDRRLAGAIRWLKDQGLPGSAVRNPDVQLPG